MTTREDIIRMAREAGWVIHDDLPYMDIEAIQEGLLQRLERFHALAIADHEREKAGAQALREAEEKWQPIETAPVDGTEFLGFRGGRIASACRIQRDDCEMWEFAGRSAAVEVWPSIKPTHWMPLPPAPDAALRQQGGQS